MRESTAKDWDWTDGTTGDWQIPGDSADPKAAESDLPPMEDGAELIKTFTTWTLVDLAISVATGTDWLAKFPTKRGRVLYINLELQGAFFTKRLRDVCDAGQLHLEPGYLTVWNLRGKAADLAKLRPLLLQWIGGNEYALIIIDPIYKLLGLRDENKAGDIASLLNEIEALAVETAAAIAFGAHYSKGNQAGKEVIDRIGGSGVFARDPDSILNFTRHEEENCFTVDATLRNHPPLEAFVARWAHPLMCADNLLDPGKLKQPGGRPEIYRGEELLELITQPMAANEIVQAAKEELGMPERRVFELLKELKQAGTIVQPEKRGKYEQK
jgi:AAA domain